MNDPNLEVVSADDFIGQARKATGIVLQGFVAYDPQYPDSILFGRHPFQCPSQPIPKDDIVGIRVESTHHCRPDSSHPRIHAMWRATVYLKQPDRPSRETELYANLLSLVSQAACEPSSYSRGADCECDEPAYTDSPAAVGLGYRARCFEHPQTWQGVCYDNSDTETNRIRARRHAKRHNRDYHEGQRFADIREC